MNLVKSFNSHQIGPLQAHPIATTTQMPIYAKTFLFPFTFIYFILLFIIDIII